MYLSVDEYISELVTREEIIGFLSDIEKMHESVYRTGETGLERVLQTSVGEKSARVLREDLQRQDKMNDSHFQEKFLDEISTKLKQIPVVSLDLASEPSREFAYRLRDKISEYVGSQVVIDYKVIPELMGGVRVAFGGKYLDYSLDSMWPQIWGVIKEKLQPE